MLCPQFDPEFPSDLDWTNEWVLGLYLRKFELVEDSDDSWKTLHNFAIVKTLHNYVEPKQKKAPRSPDIAVPWLRGFWCSKQKTLHNYERLFQKKCADWTDTSGLELKKSPEATKPFPIDRKNFT